MMAKAMTHRTASEKLRFCSRELFASRLSRAIRDKVIDKFPPVN